MTIVDDNVTPLPTLLERLGRRIDAAWQRIRKGDSEWIEGSLEAMQALTEGRERFPSHQAFGAWLREHGHDHFSDHERAALISLANDIKVARELLSETKSRSYELIWRNNRERFASVRKTKPRGRPKGSKNQPRNDAAPETPQTDRAYEEIVKAQAEGHSIPPKKEFAKVIGVSHTAVEKALDRVHQEQERATTVIEAEDRALAEAPFTDKGKLKIEDAIRIHKSRLDKQFEQVVNAEVRRRIDAANDAMRANYARLSQENLNLTRIVSQRGVFTETQYRQMLMLCHPDSSASPELKAELLQVLVQNKTRLIKP
jgi:hypothetical protein